MSENKMLIDATHPEETRVVVLRNGRVEEFDYESAARRLLRGSIYLAKITRVEPSLQAAFVDYGGNRHGFLAFNEIHPDYYQIPHSDRQALLDEEQAVQRSRNDDDDIDIADDDSPSHDGTVEEVDTDEDDETETVSFSDDSEAPVEDDDSDEPDPEDSAIDVTHLLPPEPENGTESTSAADESVSHGEDNSQSNTDGQESGDGESDDTDRKPPRTIAASINDGDKIVSDVVVPGEIPATDDAAPSDADESSSSEDVTAENAETEAADANSETGVTAQAANENMANDSEAEVAADSEREPEAREEEPVEDVGNQDALEEVPQRPRRRLRSYKIQEVIKRRQIVLIQVVKEERGNKGAALTTYLSLAGRYTVLMPNTARGGGISRKITNLQDRKRLKAIAQDLDVPEGMGLIIRTAGASRTKQEIKRDFEYLLRLWENVRDLTLQSTAPSLVYEEGDLIKRSIRDLYSKDIGQILVAGGDAHREAKSFMRMLMPSHAKNVIKYEDPQPLFARYGIESQLNAMFSPVVQLRSGGYLVINQTEALVAVDVNSGKATKEFSIEETALKTNLEAAEELSRQLKLRDLAGLIVVDFIDMEEKRNNRSVERKLKDCLRHDRARIQVGRISHFGLLEMSRQRLRTGVLEGSTMQCPHCQGTGTIRSTESVALAVLRSLEDTLMGGPTRSLVATTAPEVALYLLNYKRHFIQDMEARYGIIIHVQASDAQHGANFTIERLNLTASVESARRVQDNSAVSMETASYADVDEPQADTEVEPAAVASEDGEERRSRRRKRRRRRGDDRGSDNRNAASSDADESARENDTPDDSSDDSDNDNDKTAQADDRAGDEQGDGQRRRPRRRGRRGGRRSREQRANASDGVATPGAPQPEITFTETPSWPVKEGVQETSSETPAASKEDTAGADAAKATADDTSQSTPSAEVEAKAEASAEPQAAEATKTEATPDVPAAEVSAETAEPVKDNAAGDDAPQPVAQESAAEREAAPVTAESSEEENPASATPEAAPNGHDKANGTHEPVAEAEEEQPAPRRSPGAQPVSTAPRLERIVMSPDRAAQQAAADASSEGDEKLNQKKGWWQRRFGG